jgi:hypothetical protein
VHLKRRRTKGNLNKLIDGLVHPYFDDHPALIFVDGLLHAAVEEDPSLSLRKFVKYSGPILLEQLKKQKTTGKYTKKRNRKDPFSKRIH